MPLRIPTWPPQWPEIEACVVRSIRSGDWGNYHSQACQSLCDDLAKRFQARHVRLCCSGSAAVEIALRAAGILPGDEVILSAFDYPGNFRAVELIGARPVLIDLAPDSVQMNVEHLQAAASDRVKAVIASHLFGVPADIGKIRQGCEQHGWVLIEDACQVPGMQIEFPAGVQTAGRCELSSPAGSVGHFGTLSFGGSKPLTAGSGGALLTSDPKLAARLGPLLDRPSDTMPLSPLQATVLQPQLDRLDSLNRQRQQVAEFIESRVAPQLVHWQWLSPTTACSRPAHYKVAWAARDREHRQRVVAGARRLGLPMGEGFRSMARCSERRCRQAVPLPHSTRLGESVFVLDHTALLVEPDQLPILSELLIELHDSTCPPQ
jgi:dTDP-4-amino-4,6-dideoxygalactose transaminase